LRYPSVLTASAACLDAAPTLFDATEGVLVTMALSYCERCPVRTPCREFVRPNRSYYDGVVAGALWRNGRRVDWPEAVQVAIDWTDDESPPGVRGVGA